jgi:cysteinyl-tRNA synthetase
VLKLAEARAVARAGKNWTESDRIRDRLAALGWEVRDTPQGPKLKRIRK